jgi:hypothetical protein
VTLFECKARALQHFGILDRLESSWQQRPGTPDSKGRILNSSTNGYASSSRHRRRTSLIPTGTLTGDGSQDSLGIADLAKAAEVLASYSLLNVCGGYTHDDQKKIGLACVDFDLLVVSIRFCAILRRRQDLSSAAPATPISHSPPTRRLLSSLSPATLPRLENYRATSSGSEP